MFIKEILNIDRNAHEADIIVSDGKIDILCHTFDYLNDNIKSFELSPLDYDEVYAISEKEFKISNFSQSKYDYQIHCEIIDIKNGIVKLCGIKISLGKYLPGDLTNGDWITVKCYRMDIYLDYD